MPRRCGICDHPKRRAIEVVLKNNRKTFQKISEEFLVSPSALFRHKQQHLNLDSDFLSGTLELDRNTLEEVFYKYNVEVAGTLVGQLYLHNGFTLITENIRLKKKEI